MPKFNAIYMTEEQAQKLRESCKRIDWLRKGPDFAVSALSAGAGLTGPYKLPIKIGAKLYKGARKLGWEPLGPRDQMCDGLDAYYTTKNTFKIFTNADINSDQKFSIHMPEFSATDHAQAVPNIKKTLSSMKVPVKKHDDIINAAEKLGVSAVELNHGLKEMLDLQQQTLNQNNLYNERLKKLDEKIDRMEAQNQLLSLAAFGGFIGHLGEVTKCKELHIAGTIAQAGLTVAAGINGLIGAVGVAAFAGPVSMIGFAAFSIISLFMKSGPDVHEIILQQIGKISDQIKDLDKKMTSMVISISKGQQEILETVVKGINLLYEQNDKNYRSLDTKLTTLLQDIKQRLDFLIRKTAIADIEMFTQDLRKGCQEAQQLKNGNYGSQVLQHVVAINHTLLRWATDECKNKLLTGTAEYLANPNRKQIAEQLTNLHTSENINLMLGYLALMARYQYSADLISTLDNIANPEIWLTALQNYIDLNTQFTSADIDSENIALQQIMTVGKKGLALLDNFKEDKNLWKNLFAQYKQALEKIKTHARSFVKNYSEDVLRKHNRNASNIGRQTAVTNFDLSNPPKDFIEQFSKRGINALSGKIITMGELAKITAHEQDALNKKPVLDSSINKIPAPWLAAEFLELLTLSAQQSAELIGVDVYNLHMLGFFTAIGLNGDVSKVNVNTLTHGSVNQAKWSFPVEIKVALPDELSSKTLATSQISGSWKNFKFGNADCGCYFNEKNYITSVVCRHDEVSKVHAQLREFMRDSWNNADSSLEYADYRTCLEADEANKAINKYFVQHRKNIVNELSNLQNPNAVDFNDALTELNIHVAMIRNIAHLIGKDVSQEFFSLLLTSEEIIKDLEKFAENESSHTSFLGSVDDAIKKTYTHEDILKQKDADAQSLTALIWKNGIARLEMFECWKNLFHQQFQDLASYVDPAEYVQMCNKVRDLLFQRRAFSESVWQFKIGFVRAGENLLSIEQKPLNGNTSDFFYKEHVENILDWTLHRSKDKLFTEFQPNLTLDNLDNVQIGQLAEMYLQPFGWSCNIRSLMQYAAAHGGCTQHSDPANFSMLIEGTRAYLDLVVNNESITKIAEHAGDDANKRTLNIIDMYKIAHELQEIIASIACSKTLFANLFNKYLETIKQPYEFIKAQTVNGAELDGAKDSSAKVYKLLASDTYVGARNKLFDRLSTYMIWILSYAEMAFGYDFKVISKDTVSFEGEQFKLYTTRDDLLQLLQESKMNSAQSRMEQYIQEVTDFAAMVLNRIDRAKDMNNLHQYLMHSIKIKNTTLIIDDKILSLPITSQNVGQIVIFLLSCDLESICFKNVKITNELLEELFVELSKYPAVKRIYLQNVGLDAKSFHILYEYIPKFINLECLDLSANNFAADHGFFSDFEKCLEMIDAVPNLQLLNLAQCGMSSVELAYLIFNLNLMQRLQVVNLSDNNFETVGDELKNIYNDSIQTMLVDFSFPVQIDYAPAKSVAPLYYKLGQPVLDEIIRELKATIDDALNNTAQAGEQPIDNHGANKVQGSEQPAKPITPVIARSKSQSVVELVTPQFNSLNTRQSAAYPGFIELENLEKQLGWNCFDVAVGVTRDEIVQYAYERCDSAETRSLLAPEIKQALVATVAYLNASEEERERVKFKSEEFLPASMFESQEKISKLCAITNKYTDPRNATNVEVINEFQDFCSSKEIYSEYLNEYYAKKKWFAFNAEFTGEHQSSMIDIVARMLESKIVIHTIGGKIYETADYGGNTIHIAHRKRNHFVRLEPIAQDMGSTQLPANRATPC